MPMIPYHKSTGAMGFSHEVSQFMNATVIAVTLKSVSVRRDRPKLTL